jgi:hypothetical protein
MGVTFYPYVKHRFFLSQVLYIYTHKYICVYIYEERREERKERRERERERQLKKKLKEEKALGFVEWLRW